MREYRIYNRKTGVIEDLSKLPIQVDDFDRPFIYFGDTKVKVDEGTYRVDFYSGYTDAFGTKLYNEDIIIARGKEFTIYSGLGLFKDGFYVIENLENGMGKPLAIDEFMNKIDFSCKYLRTMCSSNA